MLRTNWLTLWLVVLVFSSVGVRAQDKGIADFPKLSSSTDWPWWRGPSRNGIAAEGSFPGKFKEADAKWKASVPGRGHSSPVVVGDRVFLTTAEMDGQKQFVLAYNRQTGKPLWKEQLNEGGFPAENHAKNTEATPTVACDGERLFATFFHHEAITLTSLNLDGKKAWEKSIGHFNPRRYKYGYAPSPLVYRDRVIVTAEYDGDSFIVALKRDKGDEIWRIKRPNNITFSSPVVAHVAGKDQLLLSGAGKVSSYDPANGQPLWSVDGTTAATCGTMVWDGDIVFASGGYPDSQTIAVEAKGNGKVLWSNNQKCYEESMIVVDGHLYALTGAGVLFCWNATTGKEMWKQRLKGPVSASPVYAGGNIYWANELGSLYVFKANPKKYEQVAENKIGTDSFPSPAAAGGQIFLRVAHGSGDKRQETLYCFE